MGTGAPWRPRSPQARGRGLGHPLSGSADPALPAFGQLSWCLESPSTPSESLRHSRRQDSGSRSLHSSRVRWDRRAERGRGSSCLASHNQHPGFRRVPLLGLGRLRCLGAGEAGASSLLLGCKFEIALNPLTRPVLASHCPSFCLLFGRSVCFLSLGMSISLFLIILAVSVCSLAAFPTWLCPSASVSLCLSVSRSLPSHLSI